MKRAAPLPHARRICREIILRIRFRPFPQSCQDGDYCRHIQGGGNSGKARASRHVLACRAGQPTYLSFWFICFSFRESVLFPGFVGLFPYLVVHKLASGCVRQALDQ